MPPASFILDGITSLDAGVNSGLVPELLKNNQLSFATNMTMRGGYGRTRPPFKKIALNFFGNLILQDQVENALWQGAAFFKSEFGVESIIASIGGRIIEFVPDAVGISADVFDRTPITNGVDDPNSSGTSVAWLWQSERWMIINNGQQLPIFYDGNTSRRSFGPTQTYGLTAVDWNVPAVGASVNVTLVANYTGPYNTNIFVDDVIYQVNASAAGYGITLKNISEPAGITVPAGVPAIIPTNFVSLSTGVGLFIDVGGTLRLNYQPVDPSLDIFHDKIQFDNTIATLHAPGSGNVFKTYPVSGPSGPGGPHPFFNRFVDLRPFPPADLASTVANTLVFAGYFNSTNTIGNLTQSFVTPAVGATVNTKISMAFNGALGQRVIINGGLYEITGTNNIPTPSNIVNITNVTDDPTVVTARGPATPTTPGLFHSMPELPISKQGAYGRGRNWVVLPDGRSYIASDIVGGPSGSAAVSFRDAVLRVTENTLLAGGGAFVIPGNIGDINWLGFPANLDTSLGQGPLQIGTSTTIFSCNAPVDRSAWATLTNPIQTEALKGKGPLSFYGTVFVNSDTIFRALDGIGSLIIARRDFDVWGNAPISFEMQKVIDADDTSLLSSATAIQFNNRMLMSAIPFSARLGVAHHGIIALNLDPVSGLRGKAPSIYDGFWTGLNAFQFVTGKFQNVERGFAFAYESFSTRNALYEIESDGPNDNFDNDSIPITTSFESAAMFKGSKQKGEFDSVQLDDGEIYLSELKGVVTVESWFKPIDSDCWTPWRKFSVCANNLQTGLPIQYRHRLGLGKPDITKCDPTNNRPFCVGTSLQVRLQISGSYRFMGALFKAVPYTQTEFSVPICKPLCDVVAEGQTCEPCKDQGDCLRFPLVFYNLNDNKQYQNNLQTITVTCPNGKQVQVTIPAGTVKFTLPFPPGYTGDYPPLVMKCGDTVIVRELPSGSTQDEIDTIVEDMIQQCVVSLANAQVDCTEIFTNDQVTFTHDCTLPDVLTYSGTLPGWITIDTGTSQLIGAAGVFTGATKDDANAAAQNALNEFGNTALGNGSLTCANPAPPLSIILVNAETVGWGADAAIGFVEVAGVFYGVGGTNFYSSTDGVNWTDLGAHGISDAAGLTFGAGLFVVPGAFPNNMWSSPTGAVWTPHAVVVGMEAVTFGAGLFVASGAVGGNAATSPDGLVWTPQIIGGGTNHVRSLAFGVGLYVAAGQDGVNGTIYSSPDGAIWTLRVSSGATSNFRSVSFSNSLFIAVGNSGRIYTSPDGLVWTLQAQIVDGTLVASGGGAGTYVICTFGGDVYTSPDGIVWTLLETEPSNRIATQQGVGYYSVANVIDVGYFP